MTLVILASSIALVTVISITISRQKRKQKQQESSFWERERRANSVRKKPLDNLKAVAHAHFVFFAKHALKR